VNLIAFNDFHGAIDAPTGSGGLVNGTPAGGVEYLAHAVLLLHEGASRTRSDLQLLSPAAASASAGPSPTSWPTSTRRTARWTAGTHTGSTPAPRANRITNGVKIS
jgi:hypothetical protein